MRNLKELLASVFTKAQDPEQAPAHTHTISELTLENYDRDRMAWLENKLPGIVHHVEP